MTMDERIKRLDEATEPLRTSRYPLPICVAMRVIADELLLQLREQRRNELEAAR